jgi:hypothetical protein
MPRGHPGAESAMPYPMDCTKSRANVRPGDCGQRKSHGSTCCHLEHTDPREAGHIFAGVQAVEGERGGSGLCH